MNGETSTLGEEPCYNTLFSSHSDSTFWKAGLVWGLATLFYFYDNLLQVAPSAMKTELFNAFVTSDEAFGSLSAYCLYAYGLMQIPAGLLVDKYGPRRLLTIACLLCALGSLLFGGAQTLFIAKIARLCIGIGAAFAVVCCLKIASIWFRPRHFSLLTGIMVTVGMLGAVFSLSTVGYLVTVFGWREALIYGGIVGVALSVLIWLMVSDQSSNNNKSVAQGPQGISTDTVSINASIVGTLKEMGRDLWAVMHNARAWLIATYAGLMFVPTLAFGGLWGIPFMQEVHGLDRTEAGISVSLIYIGWMFGAPLSGWLAEKFNGRQQVMLFANLSALAVCSTLIYCDHLSLLTIQVLLFLTGFFSSGFILAFSAIRETCAPHLAGTAGGFTNALNTFGGALAQPLIGYALDCSNRQYQIALTVLPVCLIFSIIALWAGTRKTGPTTAENAILQKI
jgi:sugar phosphate permease